MELHVVQPGDTLYRLALEYGVSMDRLIADNGLPDPSQLVVGQVLAVRRPKVTAIVREGDTLYTLAQRYGVTPRQLLRNNPNLHGRALIFPGQVLVVCYEEQALGALTAGSYAYPSIDRALLTQTLPFLSQLTPFSARFTPEGELLAPDERGLCRLALQAGTAPVFHLSNLDGKEQFSPELAHALLASQQAQERLIAAVLQQAERLGYRGVDVDFEFVSGQDRAAYPAFLSRLRQALAPRGLFLTAALAPKTSDGQPGRLYEGHDYGLLAGAVDFALLMTYDWGWSGGPPMAISPLPQVEQVLDYALTKFSPERLYLGIPNYGYDWSLPYREGSRAKSLDNVQAVRLAWDRHVAIRYDQSAQAPWFRYVDAGGTEHEVWFEDARSIRAKVTLALNRGLHGVGYWNLDRPFPQNWTVLSTLAKIRDGGER